MSSNNAVRRDRTNERPAVVENNHVGSVPKAPDALIPHNRCVVLVLKVFFYSLIVLFFVCPAVIMTFPSIISEITFCNKLQFNPTNLDKPTEFGLNPAYNFRLESADGAANLGVWHVIPEGLSVGPGTDHKQLLTSGQPIVLYLHGNGDSRALPSRVGLYKKLSGAGFHVIAFDYRGYGDSTGSPSEEGLVTDSISVFKWLRQQSGSAPIYLWGHSLGSAVATQTANQLSKEGADFSGLIIEGAFTNLMQAASTSPISWPFRLLPWFSWVMAEAVRMNNLQFANDKNIGGVTVPILILHAVDDNLVPIEFGQKLYEIARQRPVGAKDKVEFVTFDAQHGYGHEDLYRAPELTQILRKFMSPMESLKS